MLSVSLARLELEDLSRALLKLISELLLLKLLLLDLLLKVQKRLKEHRFILAFIISLGAFDLCTVAISLC